MEGLTKREEEVLQLITENPAISLREMGRRMGLTSKSFVPHVIDRLIRKGYVKRRWIYVGPYKVLIPYEGGNDEGARPERGH